MGHKGSRRGRKDFSDVLGMVGHSCAGREAIKEILIQNSTCWSQQRLITPLVLRGHT